MSQEQEDAAQFHDGDSESEDVYDLYNACNGILVDGPLDLNKLDELSPAEAEVFDVQKLREVWNHIASGCVRCATIISTLNRIRGRLRERASKPSVE